MSLVKWHSRSVLFPLSVAAFFIWLFPAFVDAASISGKGITTSPISVNITCLPGRSVTTPLMVQNNNSYPEVINLKIDKFLAGDNNGHPNIYSPAAGDPSVSWVSFNKNNFIAQPHTWTTVTMTISLPPSATLGYYYAVLFTPKTSVKTTSGSASTTFKGANAILILVDTKSSNEVKSLQIEKFTSVRSVYQYLPATFNIDIRNSGNIHLVPRGDIYISRSPSNTKSIATLDINPNMGNVLPKSDRIFQATWNDGFPLYKEKKKNGQAVVDKNGQPEYSLSLNLNNGHFRFGKYYAHLVMVYSNGNQDIPIQAEVSFWVIPWTLIIIALVILMILMFGVWALVKTALGSFKNPPNDKGVVPKASTPNRNINH
ncbi:MAG TPA: hypothetical protein VFN31_02705 [Candidatus Saccharimonadales bacterium]|nr:hypothetical protein [Candidatus Saccharimonadales bacterium]